MSIGVQDGVTRRQVLVFGLSAAVGGLSLVGCGGSGHGSGNGGGGGGGSSVRLSGTVALPAGLSSKGLTFVSGLSDSSLGSGKVRATVLVGTPTLASVVDDASGRVVLIGLIDPTAGGFALDAANVAQTLVFLGVGGGQLPNEDRLALLAALRDDAGVATLSSVVAARLAADPFALENGDAELKAAIGVAVTAYGGRLQKRSAKAARSKASKSRGRAEIVRPSPAVLIDLPSTGQNFPKGALGRALAPDGVSSLPDFVSIITLEPLETAFYAYREVQSGGTVTGVRKLVGPTFVAPNRTGDLAESEAIPIPLEDPADEAERLGFVALTPLFDSPGGSQLPSPAYIDPLSEWTVELRELWKRTVALMAADIAYDAAGLGRAFYATDRLTQAMTALGGVAGVAPALAGAETGRGFAANVDLVLAFVAASDANAMAFLDAVRPLAPGGDAPSPARLAQARGVLRVSDLNGLFVAAATYGRVFRAVQYDTTSNDGETATVLSPGSVLRVTPTLTPEATTYSPGGDTVGFMLRIAPSSYPDYDSTLTYHWKAFGAGTVRLSDGKGKGGTEFDSTERFVTLRPGDDASGVQTVSVEAFSTQTGTKFSVGKATASISTGASTRFALSPAVTKPFPGGTGGWTVAYDGNPNPGGWPGIDASHLRFRWEIDSNGVGLLGVTTGTGTSVETTKNSILFFPKVDAEDGDTMAMRVTVASVDPATGAFTNLAMLTGSVQVGVGNHCRFEVVSSSFSLETLRYPEQVRILEARSGTFRSDENGPYASATYARPGSTNVDFVGLVVRPAGGAFVEGGAVTLMTGDAAGPSSAVTLYPATGLPYYSASATSGSNARVLELARNAAGAVTYMKVFTNVGYVESVSGRTLQAVVVYGIGTPP